VAVARLCVAGVKIIPRRWTLTGEVASKGQWLRGPIVHRGERVEVVEAEWADARIAELEESLQHVVTEIHYLVTAGLASLDERGDDGVAG
jgi:hypothetical protein